MQPADGDSFACPHDETLSECAIDTFAECAEARVLGGSDAGLVERDTTLDDDLARLGLGTDGKGAEGRVLFHRLGKILDPEAGRQANGDFVLEDRTHVHANVLLPSG